MHNNTQGIILWIVIFTATILTGGCSFYFAKGRWAIILAALIPWSVFLIFNLYSEYYARDKQIMEGSWVLFQMTVGSLVAIIGIASGWLIDRIFTHKNSIQRK